MSEPSNRPLALVTGASSGIGAELCHLFAGDDFDLVVCAEDEGVEVVAESLRAAGVRAVAVRADLRTSEGVEQLWAAVTADSRPLSAAALNAGVGLGGSFVHQPLESALDVIRLNVVGTVHLAKLVLDAMVAADDGRLLLTSSIASTMPGTYQAVYNASKSFVQSFAEALQTELTDTTVTVTALMPGPTETNFFHRAGMDDTRVGRAAKDDPADVARQGYDAMMAGRRKVVAASALSKASGALAGVLPDAAKAQLHKLMAGPDPSSRTDDPTTTG